MSGLGAQAKTVLAHKRTLVFATVGPLCGLALDAQIPIIKNL
jgi:hypothetical protein